MKGKPETVSPCISCNAGCAFRVLRKGTLSCGVNPACGRESSYGLTPAMEKKKVMVVGGGPAGMEAARVSAMRGHSVDLFEKTDRLGGMVIPAAGPEFKHHDMLLINWYEQELKTRNVNVQLNTEVTAETVNANEYDSVIFASGANPVVINIPGSDKNNVMIANDVLLDESKAGDKVVVIGGGTVGCETAIWLAQKGKQCAVVELSADILGGKANNVHFNYDMASDLISFHNIDLRKNAMATEINEKGVIVKSGEREDLIEADTVILALGFRPETALYKEFESTAEDTFLIGDAKGVKNIMYAIWDGYEVGRNL